MLNSIIAFSLSQRVFTLMMAVLLTIAGAYATTRIPIDAFPNISPVQTKIILKAPGMTPEEVEARVIVPLEMELLGIPHQVILRSSAKYAIADITIDFEEGTDIYWARQQVSERLAGVRGDLPANISGGLSPISTPLSDVFMFTVESDSHSLEERRSILDWTIRPALRTLPGVADVNALGGYVRAFEVVPDPALLATAGLSITDLAEAIGAANRNDGAGRLQEGEKALVVRAEGAVRNAEDLALVVIKAGDGKVLRIGDVAEVKIGSLTRYGAVTRNGKGETVEGLVLSLRGADASAVVKSVRAKLDEVRAALPPGLTLHTFYDRSELVQNAISAVSKALMEAIALVLVLLLLFLGNLRAAAVVAVALPLSALMTFGLLQLAGMSANLMSLGGLAIAIGLIVDAAVVVVENVSERLAEGRRDTPALHLVYRATAEVALPVASGIVIICLVFLPLLSLQGLEGKLFAPVAITIVLALSASLILSLTVIPTLASFALKRSGHGETVVMRLLTPIYERTLRACLSRPWPSLALAAIATAMSIGAYLNLGKAFMPTMDEGSVIIQTTKLPSIGLARSLASDLLIQRTIMQRVPEVSEVVARVGADELGLDPMGLNETDVFLVLKPKPQWRIPDKDWLVQQLRETMAEIAGVDVAFSQPIEMRTSEMLTGARGDLAVKIFGPDLQVLADLAARIRQSIAGVAGATEVNTLSSERVDYLGVRIDRLAAGRARISVTRIEDEMRGWLEGVNAGIVSEMARRTQIVVRSAGQTRQSPMLLEQTPMATGDGGIVRLGDVAKVERTSGPVKLDRENSARYALVQANVGGRDLVSFVEDAQKTVSAQVSLPAGYRIVWGGEFENQRRAATRLSIVVPVAIGLIFLVLFATLRSMRHALIILANVPFAMIGGVISLWLSGEYLSVPASIGFIALLGIAILNGLVLVTHFNQLIASGVPLDEAVHRGAVRRLRPVLMTATIAAFGLIPLIFASGPGSEIQRPLAVVVIGGLISSTLLTLILLPIVYRRFGRDAQSGAPAGKDFEWTPAFAS